MSGMKKGPGGRPVRIPLGARNILTAPKRNGYVRRFVNDEPGRVKMYEEAGYTVVKEDIEVGNTTIGKETQPGSAVKLSVGGDKNAVLMEIKEDWHKEDQIRKNKAILVSENDMKRKLNTGGPGTYGQVSIT